MVLISKDYESPEYDQLFKALSEAQGAGVSGVVLSNTDPETDYKALVEKNRNILEDVGLSIVHEISEIDCAVFILTTELKHVVSGQYMRSAQKVDPRNEEIIYLNKRMAYEGLFGIASSNCAMEERLFGPRKEHRQLPPLYDNTADFIEHKFVTSAGETKISRMDRRKFEGIFPGMTSEEEATITFEIPEPRRISWSDMKLFLQCPRCFYNAKKFKIKLNEFDENKYGLEKHIDILLKKEFDRYRREGKKHPIMDGTDVIKPLRHKKLDNWRLAWDQSNYRPGGIQYHDVWSNCLVFGGVDDVWLNDKDELIIVDYKCSFRKEIHEDYKKQIEFYAWLFRKNNYTVASRGYLLFCSPSGHDGFEWKLEFDPSLVAVIMDDSWVQDNINGALDCLSSPVSPTSGLSFNKRTKCNVCDYFDKLTAALKNSSD